MESVAVWVGLVIVVLVHIVSTVWWASRVSAFLEIVQRDVQIVIDELKLARGVYTTKEEMAAAIAVQQKEISAVWKKLDKLPEICPMK